MATAREVGQQEQSKRPFDKISPEQPSQQKSVQWKDDSKGNSKIFKADTPVTAPECKEGAGGAGQRGISKAGASSLVHVAQAWGPHRELQFGFTQQNHRELWEMMRVGPS